MTTSGVTTYNAPRDAILKRSLRLVGAYPSFGSPRPEQMMNANEALNMMLKSWQVQNNIWLREFVTLYLSPGQASYSLPGANGASTVVETKLDGNLSTSDTAVTVDSTTGMTAGNVIGIVLSDKTVHWTTIASVNSSTTLTLSVGVTGAATDNALVYTYSSANGLFKPTRVFSAKRIDGSGNETPLEVSARDTYNLHSNKTTRGTPVEVYFEDKLSPAKLYVWPTSDTGSTRLFLDVDRPIQVALDSGDTFDLPMEWQECIAYGLGVRLAPEYKLPIADRQLLTQDYSLLLSNLVAANIEFTSTFFQPGE